MEWGDKMRVRCINNCDGKLWITISKEYDVLYEGVKVYNIINDKNIEDNYNKDRFEIVKDDEMRLVCIDNENGLCDLTIGKEYNVLDESDIVFCVTNDIGCAEGFFKRRFEVVKEGKPMKKIKIKKWEDLVGLESKDKWGNPIRVNSVSGYYISLTTPRTLLTFRDSDKSLNRYIYLDDYEDIKGGTERVLEELKMCGFDVEFIKKPKLTDEQKLELEYFRRVRNMFWIAKDMNGKVCAHISQPVKEMYIWNCDSNCDILKLDYDFISWGDVEPWSIEELLEGDE